MVYFSLNTISLCDNEGSRVLPVHAAYSRAVTPNLFVLRFPKEF